MTSGGADIYLSTTDSYRLRQLVVERSPGVRWGLYVGPEKNDRNGISRIAGPFWEESI